MSRLLIIRETVELVLGEVGQPTESPPEESDSGPARSQGSPIGVLTKSSRQAGRSPASRPT